MPTDVSDVERVKAPHHKEHGDNRQEVASLLERFLLDVQG